MRELELPNADFFAALVVFSLSIIVLWDGWMIWRSTKEIPSLGNLANGGFAWSSISNQEAFRQWGNLFSMAAMMVLPWSLASVTDTSIYWLIIWDVLLAIHLISLLVPKRYAVTPPISLQTVRNILGICFDCLSANPKKGSFYIGRAGGYLLHFPLEGPSKILRWFASTFEVFSLRNNKIHSNMANIRLCCAVDCE